MQSRIIAGNADDSRTRGISSIRIKTERWACQHGKLFMQALERRRHRTRAGADTDTDIGHWPLHIMNVRNSKADAGQS